MKLITKFWQTGETVENAGKSPNISIEQGSSTILGTPSSVPQLGDFLNTRLHEEWSLNAPLPDLVNHSLFAGPFLK